MKEHSTCDLPSLFVVLAISTCAVLAGAPEARAQTVRKLSISNNDAIYVPQTGRIYASVPSTAPPYGNNVVAIDPATATVVASVFVGSEPGRLAVSDDGTKLYVGLNGAAAVRVVDLPTFTAGLQFSLPGLTRTRAATGSPTWPFSLATPASLRSSSGACRRAASRAWRSSTTA